MLISQYAASKIPFAPTKQALNKKAKKIPPPQFFVEVDGKMRVDTDHPEWRDLLNEMQLRRAGDISHCGIRAGDVEPPPPRKRGRPKKIESNKQDESEKIKPELLEPPAALGKIKAHGELEKIKPKDTVRKKTKDEIEFDKLYNLAARAKLQSEINKTSIQEYRLEQEKMQLKLRAGQLAEVPYMEFVYISHIEKLQNELLRLTEKIKSKINPFVQEKDTSGVLKILKNEITETIRDVKKGQIESCKSWKKELKYK